MTPQELQAWVGAAGLLIHLGATTAETVRKMFVGAGMTEEQVDQLLAGIQADAARAKAVSQAIVDGAGIDG